MMTEMMLAFYKGEKLIGYEWQLTLEKAIKVNSDYADWFKGQVEITDMVKLYSRSLSVWTIFELPNCDSFHLGIKLPDGKGWLFDGDKVKRTYYGGSISGNDYGLRTATGTLKLGEYGWWIEGESDNHFYVGHTRIWKWGELTLANGGAK